MTESILNALVNLFALASTMDLKGSPFKEKSLLENFLRLHLNEESVADYIRLFENYIGFYLRELDMEKELPGSEVNEDLVIEKIGKQVTRELDQHDRLIVFLHLIEFSAYNRIITARENHFLSRIGSIFNISEHEKDLLLKLNLEGCSGNEPEDSCLIYMSSSPDLSEELEGAWIDRHRPDADRDSHIRIIAGFPGKLIFLFLKESQSVVFNYEGEDEITLDGKKIQTGRVYFFEQGSIIRGSSIESIYHSGIVKYFIQGKEKVKIVIEGEEISYTFPGSIHGIHPFSFSEESGQLIGVIGSSGVGKSTLLQLLSGKLPLKSGRITINGYDLHSERFKLQGIIGFVPQDDLLFEELSVFDNLYYNAKLCFRDLSQVQIKAMLERLLVDLDLYDIRELKVGSPLNKFISGGQRKRLNIGLELMREPSVLLLDEPTSGLSSMDAERIIALLKEQAAKGKLVIANIHQPSSDIFKKFDRIWVFDKGGYPVYMGNPVDSIVYFKTEAFHANASESECPVCGTIDTEQILKIIEARVVEPDGKLANSRKRKPEEWYQRFRDKIEPGVEKHEQKKILPQNHFHIPSEWVQFLVFNRRNLKAKLSNLQYLTIALLEAPVLALILAFISKYYTTQGYSFSENKNLPQYLFMSVIVALFIGLTISAEEIFKDRKIILRESFLNLSRFSYINAKVIYLFLLSAFQTLTFVLIGNYILEIEGLGFLYWLILFSTACFANMVGLNLSSGLDSIIAIYILIPLVLVPQLILSGVIIAFDDLNPALTNRINVPLSGDLMASRWAYEALTVGQFMENKYEKNFYVTEQQISDYGFKSAFLIPRLQTKIEEVSRHLEDSIWKPRIERDLAMVKKELKQIATYSFVFPFEFIDKLTAVSFTQEIAEETMGYLTYLKIQFVAKGEEANRQKDSVFNVLQKKLTVSGILDLKSRYYNNKISDIVLNRNELNKIIETNDQLVQKKDPIFMYPRSDFGRAHFYAPFKKLNGQHVKTVWFNTSMIWVMVFILYLTLLTDLLRLILNYSTFFMRYVRNRIQNVRTAEPSAN